MPPNCWYFIKSSWPSLTANQRHNSSPCSQKRSIASNATPATSYS